MSPVCNINYAVRCTCFGSVKKALRLLGTREMPLPLPVAGVVRSFVHSFAWVVLRLGRPPLLLHSPLLLRSRFLSVGVDTQRVRAGDLVDAVAGDGQLGGLVDRYVWGLPPWRNSEWLADLHVFRR
jgi:hypothetical protein